MNRIQKLYNRVINLLSRPKEVWNRIIYNRVINFLSRLKEVWNRIYNRIIGILSKHKKIAIVLSHGGLHLFVLLLLFALALFLYSHTKDNDAVNVNHVRVMLCNDNPNINDSINQPYLICSMNCRIDLRKWIGDMDRFNLIFGFVRSDHLAGSQIHASHFKDKEYKITSLIQTDYGRLYKFEEESYKNSMRTEAITNHIKLKNTMAQSIPLEFDIMEAAKDDHTATSFFFFELDLDYSRDYLLNAFPAFLSASNNSSIRIDLGNNMDDYKPIVIKNIYPEPDIITPFYVEYTSKKSIESILVNKGFTILYENIIERNKKNRESIQYTVLIGAIIAFMLDIIVNLILKWRRLSKDIRRKNQ